MIFIARIVFGSTFLVYGSTGASISVEPFVDTDTVKTSAVGTLCASHIDTFSLLIRVTLTELAYYNQLARLVDGEVAGRQFCDGFLDRMTFRYLGIPSSHSPDKLDRVMRGIAAMKKKAPCLATICNPIDTFFLDSVYPETLAKAGVFCQRHDLDKSEICLAMINPRTHLAYTVAEVEANLERLERRHDAH